MQKKKKTLITAKFYKNYSNNNDNNNSDNDNDNNNKRKKIKVINNFLN